MLTVAATIPDAAARDQFADRLAHKARITESVVRDEIRKAAAQRKTEAPAIAVPTTVRIRPAEQGLLWTLVHRPVEGLAARGAARAGGSGGSAGGAGVRGWRRAWRMCRRTCCRTAPGASQRRRAGAARAGGRSRTRRPAAAGRVRECPQASAARAGTCARVQDEIDRLQRTSRRSDDAHAWRSCGNAKKAAARGSSNGP